jgi:predicted DNA-binding protein (UPF0251 family)/predicted Fe-Mo cluster-binding NifX family protein
MLQFPLDYSKGIVMGRSKIKRVYSFKPVYKEFTPKNCDNCAAITLNHDEIEAIFLMDSQNMYQDDAAKKMGVSRPTFSKIIKSARFKIATALVSCKKIVIKDEKESFKAMICTDSKENFEVIAPVAKYIAVITVENDGAFGIEYFDNPVVTKNSKPGMELPRFASTNEVNFFISDSAGAGLINSLLSMGIFTEKKAAGFSIEDIVSYLVKKY